MSGLTRIEIYNKLSDLLIQALPTSEELYEIVDFILDNFEPKADT